MSVIDLVSILSRGARCVLRGPPTRKTAPELAAFSSGVLFTPVELVSTPGLNLNAPMHLIGHLLPSLLARPEAAIVNVTSGLAIAPRSGGPVYCATKAGLRSFTQALRHNLRGTKVHVIEALPPVVETAMTAARQTKKMPASECAAQIVDAIESNKDEANVGIVDPRALAQVAATLLHMKELNAAQWCGEHEGEFVLADDIAYFVFHACLRTCISQ